MRHRIDWSRPATLIRGTQVAQFGEGYRQVSGATVAEGSADEMLELFRGLTPAEAARTFMLNVDGGNPLTLEEVDRLALERG